MCEFCIELSGNAVDAFDRWLHWDANLAIGPTIGHFTPGYLLFVPLEHRSSFARLSSPTLRDAADYLTFTRLLVSQLYGPQSVDVRVELSFQRWCRSPSRQCEHRLCQKLHEQRNGDLASLYGRS
jgi:hypothetical protein